MRYSFSEPLICMAFSGEKLLLWGLMNEPLSRISGVIGSPLLESRKSQGLVKVIGRWEAVSSISNHVGISLKQIVMRILYV